MARRRPATRGGSTTEKAKVMMWMKISVILALIGFLMVLSAIYMEFWGPFTAIVDSESSRMLITMKLGGIGFILTGIFISLVCILKALTMMPVKLKGAMRGR